MIISEWKNCYDAQWTGLIIPEAFSHPAKFSPGLIKRIYEHCMDQGYVKAGDVVVDPFGGIGGGGIFAPMFGLKWIGVELEAKFVSLAHQNFVMHKPAWRALNHPFPIIIQGNSRRLSAVLSRADLILTSSPYAESMEKTGGIDPSKSKHIGGPHSQMNNSDTRYGHTEGQLGAMKAGDVSLVCTSPPFMGITPTAGDPNYAWKFHGDQSKYGSNPQNIGNLPAGKVENVVSGIVTSPPWEKSDQRGSQQSKVDLLNACQRDGKGHGDKDPTRYVGNDYGASPGQIGQESGNTYWEAVRDVYAECFKILKPGGVLVCVVKSYIKAGRRVPLPMQTLKLLLHLGFEPVERIKALLVKKEIIQGLFGEVTKIKSRKSFFRRLCEKRGSPEINWEEVLIVRQTP